MAKRWVVNRVAELGWTEERFQKFERYHANSDGRHSHGSERIGKKYQWIAYHELVARISSHCHFLGSNGKSQPFRGAWQLLRRDIDPTLPFAGGKNEAKDAEMWWRIPLADVSESIPRDEAREWVRGFSDLPEDFAELRIKDTKTGEHYLVLDTYQSIRGHRANYDSEYRILNNFIDTIIVSSSNIKKLIGALRGKNIIGTLRNRQDYSGHAFLREYPWHESWQTADEPFLVDSAYGQLPEGLSFHYPTRLYTWEGSGYDHSIEDSVSVLLPSAHLIDELDLELCHSDLSFRNREGHRVFFDPAFHLKSNPSGIVDELEFGSWLSQRDLVSVSAITTRKQFVQPRNNSFLGELTDCQIVLFDGGNLRGERWTILTEGGPTDTILRGPFDIKFDMAAPETSPH